MYSEWLNLTTLSILVILFKIALESSPSVAIYAFTYLWIIIGSFYSLVVALKGHNKQHILLIREGQ